MKLGGKVAVVTGASSGIGAGIAKALGAEGATVVVNYATSKDGADAVVASIEAAGGQAVAVRADMSRSADVVRLFDQVKADHGKVDVLVNNAGVAVFEMVADLSEEAFHKQFNVNVLGYFLAIREAVKLCGDAGGSIINISSILSTDPYMASSERYSRALPAKSIEFKCGEDANEGREFGETSSISGSEYFPVFDMGDTSFDGGS
jgi:3-oxoacyl-[acyl-carrier protein] reductase